MVCFDDERRVHDNVNWIHVNSVDGRVNDEDHGTITDSIGIF